MDGVPRLAPGRVLAPAVAKALVFQFGHPGVGGVGRGMSANLQIARGASSPPSVRAEPGALSRVARVVRMIDDRPGISYGLEF